MLHINVLHKSTYVFSPPWSHCFARALFRTAIAPPDSIVGHANSGQFLGSLLSDHSTQLLRIAIADVTVTILLLFHFDSLGRLECEGYNSTKYVRD